jgi:hypothetical protein
VQPECIKVPLADALPGAQLAEAVCDPRGQPLLAAGVTLTERSIDALLHRGITEITILQLFAVDPAEAARQQAQALARLQQLFRSAEPTGAAQSLLTLLRRYRGEQEAGADTPHPPPEKTAHD